MRAAGAIAALFLAACQAGDGKPGGAETGGDSGPVRWTKVSGGTTHVLLDSRGSAHAFQFNYQRSPLIEFGAAPEPPFIDFDSTYSTSVAIDEDGRGHVWGEGSYSGNLFGGVLDGPYDEAVCGSTREGVRNSVYLRLGG